MRLWIWCLPLTAGLIWVLSPNKDAKSGNYDNCQACHQDKYGGTYKYMHSNSPQCLSCHSTHTSGNPDLLLASPVILCQEPCHTNLGRSHPVGNNLINPDSQQVMNLTCTNYCHDAHGSNYKNILKTNARELCFSCHDF